MTDASVIIPVTSRNAHCHSMAKVALRTCRASTDAPILALQNNTPNDSLREQIARECKALGIDYEYLPGPFNIARAFNYGASRTKGKYIAYGTSDVIYFPGWLENIVAMWEMYPDYFCLVNYSFDVDTGMPCTRDSVNPENRIVHSHNPSSGVTVLKRENGYQWDEQFVLWEIDADFLYHIEANRLKAGVVYNSRCDHLIDGLKPTLDYQECFGQTADQFYGDSKAKLKAKWKDRYKGG